jgi:hypothetical protein
MTDVDDLLGSGVAGEVGECGEVVDRVRAGDLIQVGSLNEPLDRYFQFLAGAGVRDGGDFDYLIGDMPG